MGLIGGVPRSLYTGIVMRARVQTELSAGAGVPILPFLNVVILYEDFGTGLRAKRSLDLLPNRLSAKAPWSTKLWRIELLADPVLGEQAAIEAAAADVIILSLHGRSGLPNEVRKWLSGWLAHKESRPYALGVLLDSREGAKGGDNQVIAALKRVAADAGADLFYGFAEAPGEELDTTMEEINQRARSSSTLLEDMLKRTEIGRAHV
jgi:hypothetical protein